MNKFDEMFEFRLAQINEIDKIMEFYRKYWAKKDHLLAINKAFFEYEFRKDDRLGYFLAIEKATGEIVAAEGVYFYSAKHIPGETDMSTGMFLANPECKVPLIGIECMKRSIKQLKPRAYVGPGVNMHTAGALYKKMNWDVKRMNHFYILSEALTYNIAKIKEKRESQQYYGKQIALKKISSVEELYNNFNEDVYKKQKPYKDRWYITHRYFSHPVYQYQVFLAGEETVIVGREIVINGSKVFRIVDILGNEKNIALLGRAFKDFIQRNNYEYIDLYELGVCKDFLMRGGFIERKENDVNIIPNYFEPYECKNVEIYALRWGPDMVCFKADGDQDRPSIL